MAGQRIQPPSESKPTLRHPTVPATYQVRAGDTLTGIARRYNVSVEALVQANNLRDPDHIVPGQVLNLPARFQPAPRAQAKATPEAPKSALFEGGTDIGCFGRVNNDEGVNLRESPGGAILKRLPFNTRVFVGRELPGDWYFVTLDDRSFGYVYRQYVSINPPEPGAVLHEIKKGEGALQIVKRHYKGSAISWGQDERYYVNVLVEANRDRHPSGIYKPHEGADWSRTQTREGYLIWVPSLGFARSLRFKVPSGSISYEVWQAAKQAAVTVGDFLLASAAFQAGLIHGALESIWDLVTGIIDLVELLWDIFKSVFTLEIISDLQRLWELLKSLKMSELIDAGLKAFISRWDDPDLLRRWHFRGWVAGYAIAEVLMAVITGSAALLKWAGKAGKFSKFIARFPRVLKATERVKDASKRIPKEVANRLKKTVSRSPDEAPPSSRPHVPWTGHRYIEAGDLEAAKKYDEIRKIQHNFHLMYKRTGIKRRVLERVYEHLFRKVHEVPIGPNQLARGYFSPDADIARLWMQVARGEGIKDKDDLELFRRLIAHEYVESRLMEKGNLPYRSAHPKAWIDGVSYPTPEHYGAHDLAPLVEPKRQPLAHWEATLGLKPPDFMFSKDLGNLDELVQLIMKRRRISNP